MQGLVQEEAATQRGRSCRDTEREIDTETQKHIGKAVLETNFLKKCNKKERERKDSVLISLPMKETRRCF